MDATTTSSQPLPVRPPSPIVNLDDLARMTAPELASLYATGGMPKSMSALDGPLVGRMLAITLPGFHAGPVADLLRRWAGSSSFVWEGKTFQADGPTSGHGINRVSLGAALGRQNLFPFGTSFSPSVVDGRPALVLDYDRPENPPYIRRIHDEVREVSPRVYLGPAMWKRTAGSPATVLWFALQA